MLINSGSRDNVGRVGEPGSYITEGVYVGAVGARFEVEGRMEYQEVLVTKTQNSGRAGAGYGRGQEGRAGAVLQLFAEFYGLEWLPTWEEVRENPGGHECLDLRGGSKKIYMNRQA